MSTFEHIPEAWIIEELESVNETRREVFIEAPVYESTPERDDTPSVRGVCVMKISP